jgi:hypothetical protein
MFSKVSGLFFKMFRCVIDLFPESAAPDPDFSGNLWAG